MTVVITGTYPAEFYAHFQPTRINRLCIVERHDYSREITDLSKSAKPFNWISIRHSKTVGEDMRLVHALQAGTDQSCTGRYNVRIWDCHSDLATGLAAGADSLNTDIGEIAALQKLVTESGILNPGPSSQGL